jgi:hypothetical protein
MPLLPDFNTVLYYATEEEILRFIRAKEQAVEERIRQNHLEALFLVNSFVKVSLTEWMELDDISRAAMIKLAEAKSRNLESNSKAQTDKLEKFFAESRSKLSMPFETHSVINRLS